jgi:multidrug resistance efflux pump
MLIVLGLYILLVWLVFSKLKVVNWGWISGTAVALVGLLIIALFQAMFNNLTPSGSVTIIGRVVEVTPNVSGSVVSVPVKPNVPVKAGSVLFQVDQAPFKTKVAQLEASLVHAEQQVKQLSANYQQVTANVEALEKQVAHTRQRLTDIRKLTSVQAQSAFREQDAELQYEAAFYQLEAARAAQTSARLATESQVGGVNTAVAQVHAQLEHARWELEQTTVRAPADGIVTAMALSIGDRVAPTRSVISFIVSGELTLVGMFKPNGFGAVHPGASVKLVFDHDPGRVHQAMVVAIPEGVGQGQIAVSGSLARSGSLSGASSYPALISVPDTLDKGKLKIGMPGSATAFSPSAGPIGMLMSILVWVSAYTAYL